MARSPFPCTPGGFQRAFFSVHLTLTLLAVAETLTSFLIGEGVSECELLSAGTF